MMEERKLKALEIAAKSKLTRRGKTWLVPSQSVRGAQYTVRLCLKTRIYPSTYGANGISAPKIIFDVLLTN